MDIPDSTPESRTEEAKNIHDAIKRPDKPGPCNPVQRTRNASMHDSIAVLSLFRFGVYCAAGVDVGAANQPRPWRSARSPEIWTRLVTLDSGVTNEELVTSCPSHKQSFVDLA